MYTRYVSKYIVVSRTNESTANELTHDMYLPVGEKIIKWSKMVVACSLEP